MYGKHIVAALVVLLFSVPAAGTVSAENGPPDCVQLDEKASGDMIRYSLYGESNGQVFFSGISCAIEHRNQELCAMEMVSFDTTSKVFDYNTGEEIDIGKAYFWLDGENTQAPILAFSTKEKAEEFASSAKSGVVLDFTGLIER